MLSLEYSFRVQGNHSIYHYNFEIHLPYCLIYLVEFSVTGYLLENKKNKARIAKSTISTAFKEINHLKREALTMTPNRSQKLFFYSFIYDRCTYY